VRSDAACGLCVVSSELTQAASRSENALRQRTLYDKERSTTENALRQRTLYDKERSTTELKHMRNSSKAPRFDLHRLHHAPPSQHNSKRESARVCVCVCVCVVVCGCVRLKVYIYINTTQSTSPRLCVFARAVCGQACSLSRRACSLSLSLALSGARQRERERESVCVCVYVCVRESKAAHRSSTLPPTLPTSHPPHSLLPFLLPTLHTQRRTFPPHSLHRLLRLLCSQIPAPPHSRHVC
jgi:hypothetical protein